MLKRKERRWDILPMEYVKELAKTTTSESIWGENFSRPNLVTSDRLAGKTMKFIYDDGGVWNYTFFDERHLHWAAPDGTEGDDLYNATPCPGFENVIFFHHYRAGLDLPRCADVIFDLDTGYVTLFDAYIGHPGNPREVVHDIRFGVIDGVEIPEGAMKHHFTNELTGKAIHWSHDERPRGIQYIFSSCRYYTYAMKFGESECWMATNPADYLKLKEGLYIMSVVEERQPGVQLVMLMNLNIMRDVQSCFGLGGTREEGPHIETWMHANRKGRFVEMWADLTGEE